MPLVVPLILLAGLVAAALFRRSQGPIAADDGLFGRGDAPSPEASKADLVSSIATRLAQSAEALRVQLFGDASDSPQVIAGRLAAATRAQLALWAQQAKAAGGVDSDEVSGLLARLAVQP